MVSFSLRHDQGARLEGDQIYGRILWGGSRHPGYVALREDIWHWLTRNKIDYDLSEPGIVSFDLKFYDRGHAALFKLTWL